MYPRLLKGVQDSRTQQVRPTDPRFGPAIGPAALSGLAVEIDDRTGLARRVLPLRIGPGLATAELDFGVLP